MTGTSYWLFIWMLIALEIPYELANDYVIVEGCT